MADKKKPASDNFFSLLSNNAEKIPRLFSERIKFSLRVTFFEKKNIYSQSLSDHHKTKTLKANAID